MLHLRERRELQEGKALTLKAKASSAIPILEGKSTHVACRRRTDINLRVAHSADNSGKWALISPWYGATGLNQRTKERVTRMSKRVIGGHEYFIVNATGSLHRTRKDALAEIAGL